MKEYKNPLATKLTVLSVSLPLLGMVVALVYIGFYRVSVNSTMAVAVVLALILIPSYLVIASPWLAPIFKISDSFVQIVFFSRFHYTRSIENGGFTDIVEGIWGYRVSDANRDYYFPKKFVLEGVVYGPSLRDGCLVMDKIENNF